MTPVVAYLRRSGASQDGSFDRQRALLADFAQIHGMKIMRWYEETGSGAVHIRSRPQLRAALAYCLTRKVKGFLVEDADRLDRALSDARIVRELLSRLGVVVYDTALLELRDRIPQLSYVRKR